MGGLLRLAMMTVLLLSAGARAADDPVCPGSGIRVIGARATEFRDVCQGAQAARAFLGQAGLRNEPVFAIEVTRRLPDVVGPESAGCFIKERDRAYLLTYAEFRKRRTWFGVPVSRAMYRSLAAHETAHAVAGCHFTVHRPSIQAREYVAYVTMFATMAAPLRSAALKAQPGSGFEDIGRVGTLHYLFDPMLFGAESYRHYLRQDDGARFLAKVLAGEALAE